MPRTTRALRLSLAALLLCAAPLRAQEPQTLVRVQVTPDRDGWLYAPGQPARFAVSVLASGQPVPDAKVTYELGVDRMPNRASGALPLREGRATVDGGTMTEPGFLRLSVVAEVDGREYRGAGTAGFAPERIRPLSQRPADFEAFWREQIRQARTVPLAPTMTLVPEQSTTEVTVYHVSFQDERAGSRIYGMLSVPTEPGSYPAILEVPGAGVRPYRANTWIASQGAIHLAIGIHGIPVNLEQPLYDNLREGVLNGYAFYGLQDRERYYYRRVILGALRAGDFLATLPQFDREHYGVYGSSQGGALAIITAALDERIDALGAIHPALADHEAFLHGRASGWPHLFAPWNQENPDSSLIRTARYYDVVNFAPMVRVPGFYSFGYNDTVCPPTSVYAALNVIPAEKQMFIVQETAHWTYPEQWNRMTDFILARFKAAGR